MVVFSSLRHQIIPLWIMVLAVSGNCQASQQLHLEDAVRHALGSNLSLMLDRQRLAESRGVTTSAEGSFDTLFEASAGTGEKKLTPLVAGGVEEESTTNWSAGLSKTFTPGTRVSLSWDNNEIDTRPQTYLFDPVYTSGLNLRLTQPLLQGRGTENQTTRLRASKKQEEALAYTVESSSADLAAEVIKAYWDLVFSWQEIEVRKISLQLARQFLSETRERIDAGQLAEVELYTPESEVARREEGLISAERVIGQAEDRIKILMNSSDWEARLEPVDRPPEHILDYQLDTVLTNSFANRPDLRAAQLNAEAAAIILRGAEDRSLSHLDIFGAIGIGGSDDSYGDSLNNLVDDADSSWQVGITFSRPLDNSFARGEILQAKAVYDQAVTASEILRQEVRRAVRSALRDIELAEKNIEATRKTSLASRKGLEAEKTKFEAGRGTTLDVLASQERYAASLSQEKLALINYAKTLAELDRIQGIIRIPAN